MRYISQPDRVKPENIVERMMKPDRDQQSIEKSVDPGAGSTHPRDSLAEHGKPAEYHRPCKQKHNGNQHGRKSRHDHRAPLSAEESQPLGKRCVLEAVVTEGTDQACQNTDEGISDPVKSHLRRVVRFRIIWS